MDGVQSFVIPRLATARKINVDVMCVFVMANRCGSKTTPCFMCWSCQLVLRVQVQRACNKRYHVITVRHGTKQTRKISNIHTYTQLEHDALFTFCTKCMKWMLNNEVASARPPSVGLNLLEEIALNMVLLLYVVKVLCYKSEGCWFDPSWYHWKFSLT